MVRKRRKLHADVITGVAILAMIPWLVANIVFAAVTSNESAPILVGTITAIWALVVYAAAVLNYYFP